MADPTTQLDPKTTLQKIKSLANDRYWIIVTLGHITIQIAHPEKSTFDIKDNLARQQEEIAKLLRVQDEINDLVFQSHYEICPACTGTKVRSVGAGRDGWTTDCEECTCLLDED